MDLRSDQPFWLMKDGLLDSYPALSEDETCDIVILGGGITGALIAQHLSDEGVDTVLLDKRDVGTGSTAASTALLQYEVDTELVDLIECVGEANAVRAYRMGIEAIDKIEDLTKTLGDDCEFTRRNSLYLASEKSHVAKLKREYECRKQFGFDLEWLGEEAIEQEYGFNAPAALVSGGDAEIDAFRFTHSLLRHARQMGVRCYDRTNVTSIERHDGFAILTTNRGPSVKAKRIVFATGYESHAYLKQDIGELHSTFALVSEPIEPFPNWPGRCLIWETARPYFYLRTTPGNRVIIGGGDVPFSEGEKRDSLIRQKTNDLKKRFSDLFPTVNLQVAHAWAGVFGETNDGLALIGQPAERPDDYFALGYGGNGITMSVIAARLIADAITGKPNPDAQIFRFDR